MIGEQLHAAIQGVVISAICHGGLSVTVNGRPGRLAILAEDGEVVAEGTQVARVAEAVAVNAYRSLLKGQGHMTVLSSPLDLKAHAPRTS